MFGANNLEKRDTHTHTLRKKILFLNNLKQIYTKKEKKKMFGNLYGLGACGLDACLKVPIRSNPIPVRKPRAYKL